MGKATRQVNLYEAKTNLSKLVDRAGKGETIIIAKAGTPVARLAPLEEKKRKIRFGLLKGKITVPADFDAPLPDEIIDLFYKGDL
jgi:prevent-host-death family protein